MSDLPTIKLLTLGDSEVGKSSLILRFSENSFTMNRCKTLGIDSKSRVVELNGQRARVQVWDTAGQERFHTISFNFYSRSDGILLVYDVTNAASLKNVDVWMKQIREQQKSGAPVVFVGNKTDLQPEVSCEEGVTTAEKYGCEFFATSALTGSNVDDAFLRLAQAVVQWKPEVLTASPQSVLLSQKSRKRRCC